jgi:hypothetical protein
MIKNFKNYINEGSDVTMFNSFKTKYRLGQHRKIIYYRSKKSTKIYQDFFFLLLRPCNH